MSSLPRGICSVCGADVAVRRNGTIREHGGGEHGAGAVCQGAGKPPFPNPAKVTIDLPAKPVLELDPL